MLPFFSVGGANGYGCGTGYKNNNSDFWEEESGKGYGGSDYAGGRLNFGGGYGENYSSPYDGCGSGNGATFNLATGYYDDVGTGRGDACPFLRVESRRL
jgi:hypothetical protein